ncbi:MAG: efflux RND transporter permease subunit [Betaproteobacteria bacterium]|nr:efflux RND transporter permease subunit [Betaproteobacteria bacterium]
MTLPELSIKRHVFAVMLNAALILFGLIAYQRIGVDKLPYIEYPVVSVTTTQRGANPEVIDASVTNLVETAVNSVPGIEHISSTSSPGVSVVTITFNLDKRIDTAFNEVQAKVNQVLRRMPKDADPPVVAKVETNTQPIFWSALQGDRTQQQLNQYAINIIKKRLETIDGVGEIRIGGRRDRTIRVNLLPARMTAYGIAAQDINAAFANEHIQFSGGFLSGQTTEHLMKLDLEFHRLDELEKMVIAYRDGAPVRLQDIAEIEDGLADFRQLARFNGKPTVSIGVVKVPNTNTVEIIKRVRERIEDEIRPQLPPGLELHYVQNDAIFIGEMVASLKGHLVEGTLLAALIVWLFLKSFRATLIVATAIPVSLFGAIAVIYFFGYTFNSVTLLALLLLVGVVVDDAIVVLENIYRHREHLVQDTARAAVEGSREVTFAVIAASFSLVAIFAPVIFISGITGQFLRSFAVVVTFGVMVSLFVSLSLTPMLCSRYMHVEKKHGRVYWLLEHLFEKLEGFYKHSLGWALAHRWSVLIAATLISAAAVPLFRMLPTELAPQADEGRFLVAIRTPLGSSIHYTEQKLKEVEEIVFRYPDIVTEFGVIGLGSAGQVNQATLVGRMRPKSERRKDGGLSQQEMLRLLRRDLSQLAGARAFPRAFGIVQGQRSESLQFVVKGPNLQQMGRIAGELQRSLQVDPAIGRMDTDLQLDLPQLVLEPDRVRAASVGLTSQDLALAISMLTGGVDIAKYNDQPGDGERYDIRVKAKEAEFGAQADLSKIYLRNRQGQLVRLDTVAGFKERVGPAVVARFDLQYSATFYASPTVPLATAIEKVREAGRQLPQGYNLVFVGEAEQLEKTREAILFTFGLALVLLFMVLASQFNSFLQPFYIMLAVPLAIIGGVFALWLFVPLSELGAALGLRIPLHTLNIYSMIGLILLIGLVAKNSILLVDLTNQRRAQGLDVDAALMDACPTRMRPVVMTSLTIVLALFPAALGLGAGAETNAPLAVAVIGGMITSTLLTLVVVPSAYSLMENWRVRKLASGQGSGAGALEAPQARREDR